MPLPIVLESLVRASVPDLNIVADLAGDLGQVVGLAIKLAKLCRWLHEVCHRGPAWKEAD